MRKGSTCVETLGVGKSITARSSSSHTAAVGLFTLQNLRSLDISELSTDDLLDDDFYAGMCDAASQSKVSDYLNLSNPQCNY